MQQASVIQGDTLELTVHVEKPEELTISHAYLVCKSLNIETELSATDNNADWSTVFNPETTAHFRVGNFSFDVMVDLDTGERFTVIYQGVLSVLQKNNDFNEQSQS